MTKKRFTRQERIAYYSRMLDFAQAQKDASAFLITECRRKLAYLDTLAAEAATQDWDESRLKEELAKLKNKLEE